MALRNIVSSAVFNYVDGIRRMGDSAASVDARPWSSSCQGSVDSIGFYGGA